LGKETESLSEPLVTIIIPTYNRAHLIGEAIESVLNQSYRNYKIIVIDDGSTDNTREFCHTYIATYPDNIIYYYKKNGGCAGARNYGLDRLDDTTEYVCFLDSDDRFLPDKLKREVELLEASPDADFCYASSIIYTEELGRETLYRVAAAGHPEEFAIEHFMTNEAKSNAMLYRRKILNDKRFDESLLHNEDSGFLQCIAIEHQGVYCPDPGCWVRDHPGSKSRNKYEICKSVLSANQKILEMYPDFHCAYPSQIESRMNRVLKDIFVELMLEKHWQEAAMYAQNPGERLLLCLRLSIYYRMRRFLWRNLVSKFSILKWIANR
jgi:glycosyltransferase involved in cell wall biosynthesis